MRYWWVNQNQTYSEEVGGGYMWSPKRKSNGARNRFYENMREVSPGDIVFSFKGGAIAAVGRASSTAYECPKPSEFGNKGVVWSTVGWKVDVAYEAVPEEVRPIDFIDDLRPLLPEKYSPLNSKNGYGLQSVYLAEIGEEMADVLLELVDAAGGTVPTEVVFATPEEEEAWKQALEDEEQRHVEEDSSIGETDRAAVIMARRGQGKFRSNLESIESACRVTGITSTAYLVASHIWPWRHATNAERLDGENGLLLAPHVDFLFDRGLISFDGDGDLLVSPVADEDALTRMGIQHGINVGSFTPQQQQYLMKHRDGDGQQGGVFKKISQQRTHIPLEAAASLRHPHY
jgi:putative restriction endonuclease